MVNNLKDTKMGTLAEKLKSAFFSELPIAKKLEIVFSEMERLSKKEPKTLIQRYLKLGEECGELAQEIGIVDKVSGYSYKTAGKDGVIGECSDIIITALSIHFMSGGTIEDFQKKMLEKMAKWESKMEISKEKAG